MKEKPQINPGALKQKELLEKLSLEISRDFSISEKLAKKFIYETHLNLDELKSELALTQSLPGGREVATEFDDKKLEKLFFALKGAKEIIETASKKEIEELKNILDKNSDILDLEKNEESEIIKKIFSKKLIEKAKKPQNIGEQIMGASLGILNSGIIITDILYNLGKGIITSVGDLIAIISGKGEIESFKKV